MGSFYSRLSYSFGNEDFRTESLALQLKENDHVLAITASGDRSLNILSEKVTKVYSVDANPIQNALLDLKKAALQELDYPEYKAFLGLEKCNNRALLYKKLQKKMQPSSCELLLPYEKKIRKGIIYQGVVEKMLSIVSKIIRSVRGKKVDKLFSFDNIELQRDFVEKKWNTKLWRGCFKLAINPHLSRLFFNDPGLYEHIGSEIKSVHHIYDRCHNSLIHFSAKQNLIVSLIVAGKVFEEGYPPYLRKKESAQIKSQLDKIEFTTSDLISYLKKSPDKSFDVFSLSDVASYLSQEEFSTMLYEMVRTAKPDARFCIRQFLSNHTIPETLLSRLQRNFSLEKQLENEDRCFVYRFIVGTII